MSKVKVGIIGAGSISGVHFEAYKSNADAEIYAVCDLNEERAREKAAKYGASKVFTDYGQHDAILNATPQVDNAPFDFREAFGSEIHRKETLSPVGDGVERMKMLCGIYDSARTGKEIQF